MTKQELELLKNISLSLKKSTKTTWDSGNFEQWAEGGDFDTESNFYN